MAEVLMENGYKGVMPMELWPKKWKHIEAYDAPGLGCYKRICIYCLFVYRNVPIPKNIIYTKTKTDDDIDYCYGRSHRSICGLYAIRKLYKQKQHRKIENATLRTIVKY